MARPFVRAFEIKDKDEMVVIFNETADDGLRAKGDEAVRIGAHLWCIPYFQLQQENCFVLDDGTGKAVGYIIGTPDNRTFVKQWRERYIALLKDQGIPEPQAGADDTVNGMRTIAHSPEEEMLGPPVEQVLHRYPGHLHIDIRPQWQGQGFGVQLMDAFLNQLQQQGCRGVYASMIANNTGAERFYRKLGFGRYPHVIDGGKSGEQGRIDPIAFLVKPLDGEPIS